MFSDLCCLAVSWILGEIWFCGIGRGFIDFPEPCLRIYFCNQRNLFLFNKRSGHRSFQHLEFSSSTKTKLCGTKFRLMQGKHQHWVVEVVKQSTKPSNQRTGTQPEQHWEWNTLTRRKTVGWWYDIEITLSRWQICWTETMMHNVECWGFNLFFFDRFMVQCHARSLQALYHSGRSGDMDLRSCLLCLWGWRPKLVRNSRPRLSPPAVAEGCGFGWINLWISVDLASGCNLYFDIFDLLLEFSRGCFWVQARWFVPFNDFPLRIWMRQFPLIFVIQISINMKTCTKLGQLGAVGRPFAYKERWLGAGLRASLCSDLSLIEVNRSGSLVSGLDGSCLQFDVFDWSGAGLWLLSVWASLRVQTGGEKLAKLPGTGFMTLVSTNHRCKLGSIAAKQLERYYKTSSQLA